MSDLLERLRNENYLWTVPGALRKEAADEIERLQANLTTAEFDRLANEAEIERLRALIAEIVAAWDREDDSIAAAIRALKSDTGS